MVKLYNGAGEFEITFTSTGRTTTMTDDEMNELSTASEEYAELLEDYKIVKEENEELESKKDVYQVS